MSTAKEQILGAASDLVVDLRGTLEWLRAEGDLLETDKFGGRQWPGEILRLAMLMTHYREPIDFSVRKLEESANLLERLFRRAGSKDSEGGLQRVVDPLRDDLNTVAAIRELSSMSGKPLAQALELLGITDSAATGIDEGALDATIAERLRCLADKNFAEADRIRDELAAQGIQLMDFKDPDTGERATKWEVKR